MCDNRCRVKHVETWGTFIPQHDILGSGRPLYHIDRVIAETGHPFGDDAHIVCACMDNADTTPAWMSSDLQRRRSDDIQAQNPFMRHHMPSSN